MDAKEYLLKYAVLKMEALSHEERILRAFNETQLPAVKQGDGLQRTPDNGGRREYANIRYIETRDRLQPQIDANRAEMWQIEDAISCIQDGIKREVLRLRYIDGNSWDPVPWREVALKLYGDDDEKDLQRIYRIHKDALKTLGVMLSRHLIKNNAGE